MNTLNVDILEKLTSEYLNWRDTFDIRLLSKEINEIFKFCKFSSRNIFIKNTNIQNTYSFDINPTLLLSSHKESSLCPAL